MELLGVVWTSGPFINYLYGSELEMVTEHKAILSAVLAKHSSIAMHYRLTRWVNRFLPFNLENSHLPGKDMGLSDLLSRLLSGKTSPSSFYDETLVIKSTNKIENSFIEDTQF